MSAIRLADVAITMHPHPTMRPPLIHRRRLAGLVGLVVLLASCDSSDPTGPVTPPPVASIRVLPDDPQLVVGQTLRMLATPLSSGGHELPDRPVSWASADVSKATVEVDGTVTGVAEGVTLLSVSSEGVSRQVPLSVVAIPAASVWLDATRVGLLEHESRTLQAEVRDSLDRPLTGRLVTWSSLDVAVATVDDAGTVTAVGRGTTYVVARHGSLEAMARVDVADFLAADLLYHAIQAPETTPRILRSNPNEVEGTPQPVFASAGTWQVAVSPDRARLAFTCAELGPAICTSNVDGSDVRALTLGDRSYEDHPTWSPDGARLAFRRWPEGGTPGQAAVTDIWVMDADGSNQVNVTDDAEMQHEPAWSPALADGSTRIAYSQTQLEGGYLTSRVFTMRPDGSDRQAETPMDGSIAAEPAWSPDGTEIVYFKDGGTVQGDLWIARVGARDERPLMPSPLEGEQRAPSYSPDGRHVLFTSMHELTNGTTYRVQLYTVRSDGTDLVRRTGGLDHKHDPAWIDRP